MPGEEHTSGTHNLPRAAEKASKQFTEFAKPPQAVAALLISPNEAGMYISPCTSQNTVLTPP